MTKAERQLERLAVDHHKRGVGRRRQPGTDSNALGRAGCRAGGYGGRSLVAGPVWPPMETDGLGRNRGA